MRGSVGCWALCTPPGPAMDGWSPAQRSKLHGALAAQCAFRAHRGGDAGHQASVCVWEGGTHKGEGESGTCPDPRGKKGVEDTPAKPRVS